MAQRVDVSTFGNTGLFPCPVERTLQAGAGHRTGIMSDWALVQTMKRIGALR